MKHEIVYVNGDIGNESDWPIAVKHTQVLAHPHSAESSVLVVDPLFNGNIYGNLYGRIMTLLEATTEPQRLKAVKDVFSKELQSWSTDVHASAREIAEGGNSSDNLYTRGR